MKLTLAIRLQLAFELLTKRQISELSIYQLGFANAKKKFTHSFLAKQMGLK